MIHLRHARLRPGGLPDSIRLVIVDDELLWDGLLAGDRISWTAPAGTAGLDSAAGALAIRGAVADALGHDDVDRIVADAQDEFTPRVEMSDVLGARQPVELTISLSTCDGRAAATAGPLSMRVGVELERLGSITPAYERFFLSRAERRIVSTIGHTAFWALKGAAWKALRSGDQPPEGELELLFDANGQLRIASLGEETVSMRATLARPWPGYLIAVTWIVSPARKVRARPWRRAVSPKERSD
jgi:hypothetical protein